MSAGTPAPHRAAGLARHSLLLARRNVVKSTRNPGLLTDALLLPVIFLLLFVYLFGGAVAGSTHGYLEYVFPGILVMTAILVGQTATGLTVVMDVKKGVFDRFRSLPISRTAPLLGSVLGDTPRYLVGMAGLFGLGALLGFRPRTGLVPVLAGIGLAVLLGFALSWLNVLIGVLVRHEALVQSVAFLGIFPLAFGTNMLVPTRTLPGWLQAWVRVNPVGHAIDAVRGLLLGGPVAGPVAVTLLWSAGLLVVLVPLSAYFYRRRA
jgi:oleandomycin transport system permease protein